MELIAVQRTALEELTGQMKTLLIVTKNAAKPYVSIFRTEKWLDNQEVCLVLGISKRTLQTYKNKGLLPCSKLCRKNYFKLSDVQALLHNHHKENHNGTADR
ncbi:helix-turn-helix domain-containing protein [Chryseobacterium viscerum]|uniref:DNA-binding protein n=1 Tax=Chryseobacterium viscerum TaxID=1037377 RepID=A0A316WSE6_9FLAO|nr:helix-turn-helix domain-containing protein [Chryseobacterium viscerum]PWN64137.1 DNA-binding protein [Chryseobacterium viscerum]